MENWEQIQTAARTLEASTRAGEQVEVTCWRGEGAETKMKKKLLILLGGWAGGGSEKSEFVQNWECYEPQLSSSTLKGEQPDIS